jgi:hypothetical protein
VTELEGRGRSDGVGEDNPGGVTAACTEEFAMPIE